MNNLHFNVICTYKGKQQNEHPVQLGSIYTVIKIIEGWEIMHEDTSGKFYLLEEMPREICYHSKLFSRLSDIDELVETEKILQEHIGML